MLDMKIINLPKSSKDTVTSEPMLNIEIFPDLECPEPVQNMLFFYWKHHLMPFGLGCNVKKWDEHSRVLALFLQKIQTNEDGFKLHNMVADKNNSSS